MEHAAPVGHGGGDPGGVGDPAQGPERADLAGEGMHGVSVGDIEIGTDDRGQSTEGLGGIAQAVGIAVDEHERVDLGCEPLRARASHAATRSGCHAHGVPKVNVSIHG